MILSFVILCEVSPPEAFDKVQSVRIWTARRGEIVRFASKFASAANSACVPLSG